MLIVVQDVILTETKWIIIYESSECRAETTNTSGFNAVIAD